MKPHDLQGYKIGDKINYYDLKSKLHTEKIKDFINKNGEWICLMANNILLHPDRIEEKSISYNQTKKPYGTNY